MTSQDLKTLLDYHYWARDRVFAALEPLTPEQDTRDMGSSFRSVRDTVVHIYSADWIWYRRWRGESPSARITGEAFPDVAGLRDAWQTLEGEVRAHVASLDAEAIERVMDTVCSTACPARHPSGRCCSTSSTTALIIEAR